MDLLTEHFREFSNIKSSTIYAVLSGFIATQPVILQALTAIPLQKSPRTILFAAIHVLLLKGIKHPLAEFYPSLNGTKKLTADNRYEICAEFLDFFTRYRVEINPYLLKNTQTNEAKRSFALLPALSEIVKREQSNKLSLIEIGTSAGFLLNLDKYRYEINSEFYGDKNAKVSFVTKWQGALPKNLQPDFLTIENKIGIDINPLNIEDDDVKLWLKALIWPEQIDRLQSFDFACQVLKANKKCMTILKGTFEDHADTILTLCVSSNILCFFSIWVLYQLSNKEKAMINTKLRNIAKSSKKKIYFILDDWEVTDTKHTNNIILREFNHKGHFHDTIICETDHHGGWIKVI